MRIQRKINRQTKKQTIKNKKERGEIYYGKQHEERASF